MPRDRAHACTPLFPLFQADLLGERNDVYHAFLGRPSWPVDGDRERALRACAQQLCIPPQQVYFLQQVHGNDIHFIHKSRFLDADPPPVADGMVTDQPGVFLCIHTADCVPILFLDPVRRVVAAAHAGWRGTVQNVAAATVRGMQRAYGSRASDVLAALGPAIGSCCYEVNELVVRALLHTEPDAPRFLRATTEGHWMLDLQALNAHQLFKEGLLERNVQQIPLCTACRTDIFYSRRGEGGIKGEQFSLIGIIP